jgi:Domain of unknown function (DUF4394)
MQPTNLAVYRWPVCGLRFAVPVLAAILLVGCAGALKHDGKPRKENIHAVTAGNNLISFNAGQPQTILSRKPLTGLQAGEEVLGIDYRISKGVLYALGSSNRLYTINPATGAVTQVGQETFAVPLAGTEFAFDFSPTSDRIRVVSTGGQNLRLHPDTGAVVDSDPKAPAIQIDSPVAYVAGDDNAGKTARIAAAAYTYNKVNDKITTNYAIDAGLGVLAIQGTREGVTPVISSNTGKLFTVGQLGIAGMERVAFDIADTTGAAFAAITMPGKSSSDFYLINLQTGRAMLLGTVGGGEVVRGISFEP